MTWQERVFSVIGPDGLARRGVLTMPETAQSSVAAILLPAGLKDRVGPHRLYVQLARELACQGVPTLRFDPLGIGESDGALEVASNGRHFRRIQQGMYVEDALLAMEAMGKACRAERFILAGLCGGAVSAQLTAARVPERVVGVISLSSVAILDEEGPALQRTRSETLSNGKAYLRKLLSVEAWRRLLRGDAAWGNVTATLRDLGYMALGRLGIGRQRWPNANALFFSSFRVLQKYNVPHLMIFGERDARWIAFRELVVDNHLGGAMEGPGYEVRVVPEGNHEFYLKPWKDQLLEWVRAWSRERTRKPGSPVLPARERSMAS